MQSDRRLRRPILALTLASILGVFAVTNVAAFDFTPLKSTVKETVLKNGLRVIVMEKPDAPVVSMITWVRAGSVDDPKGYTGMAHMFEHMAFKGTQTLGTTDYAKEKKAIEVEDSLFLLLRAERNKGRFVDSAKVATLEKQYNDAREASYKFVVPNKFTSVIEEEGASGLNASTWNDFTNYYYSLPANRLELWMATESERFLRPVFREMYKERDVVAEERRLRTDSDPFGRLYEEFCGLAFKSHPYGISGIGHMSDIMYYSRDEADAFFLKYYGPTNMHIVIVGAVKADDVIKMADKYWGRIAYRPAPERIATIEPEQLGERRMIIEDPSQPIMLIGYHTPEMTHPDRAPLDLLASYLANGRTAVLYEKLVKEKKMAVAVQGWTGVPGEKYPTCGVLLCVPAQGISNDDCEKAIYAEIDNIIANGPDPKKLENFKAQANSSFIGQLDDNSDLGFQMAMYQDIWGDWKELFNTLDRVNRVTPDDIKRVAAKYYTKKNRVVVASVTTGN